MRLSNEDLNLLTNPAFNFIYLFTYFENLRSGRGGCRGYDSHWGARVCSAQDGLHVQTRTRLPFQQPLPTFMPGFKSLMIITRCKNSMTLVCFYSALLASDRCMALDVPIETLVASLHFLVSACAKHGPCKRKRNRPQLLAKTKQWSGMGWRTA